MPLLATHELTARTGNMLAYSGMDSAVDLEIEQNTRHLLEDEHTRLTYAFERGMQAPALEMMMRGFRVDPVYREHVTKYAQDKLGLTQEILSIMSHAIWGKELNPASPTQLKSFFYDTMGLKPIVRFEHGEAKTPMNRETLEALANYHYAAPVVNTVLLARDLLKTIQVLRTEIDSDMRWRCSYNIGGTSTGRWSSSKSSIGTGNNFQNITEELRRCFIPDPGKKLYGIDLEQAEAREVGWFCGVVFGDWTYLDMVERGDLHTQVARMCFQDLPWTGDLDRDRAIADRRFYRHFTYRDASKRLGHGTNYMGRPQTMSAHTKIPRKTCEDFHENYLTEIPAIALMHQWVANAIQTRKFLVNAFGRRRDFFDRTDSDETIRGAVAYLFQSATGDRLNLGLWRLWKYLGTQLEILSQLHDAAYFQMPASAEQEIIPIALKMMEVKLNARTTKRLMGLPTNDNDTERSFTIPGEAQGGFNWAHRFRLREDGTREEWNPQGLDKVRVVA